MKRLLAFAALIPLLGLTACATSTASAQPQTAPTPATPPPVVAIVGDSYTAGWTNTSPFSQTAHPWYDYTVADLGWRLRDVRADPGGGYVAAGWYGTVAADLSAHPISPTTDFVLIQLGWNDRSADPEVIPAAVAHLLDIVHEQAPHAEPIVIGMFNPYTDRLDNPNEIPVADAIGQATGTTRYMIGFMCRYQTGGDGVHPTEAGHASIGNYVAWRLEHGLDYGSALRWNGRFWA